MYIVRLKDKVTKLRLRFKKQKIYFDHYKEFYDITGDLIGPYNEIKNILDYLGSIDDLDKLVLDYFPTLTRYLDKLFKHLDRLIYKKYI
jgi:hypothetical protein